MKTFNELRKNLKKNFSGLTSLRVAVLGDTTTQFLVQALRGAGFDHMLDLKIWEADFDQIENQVYDAGSDLYNHNPEVIIIFHSTHKLLDRFNKLSSQDYKLFAQTQLTSVSAMHEKLTSTVSAKIIYYNYNEINDAVFGSYSAKTESSFVFQLRKLNYELMLFSLNTPNFYLCDLSTIQNQSGKFNFFQPSIYIHSEMALSLAVLPQVANRTLDIIDALTGKSKKCLILDLDNTVWGGIIGDDGIEHIQIGYLGILSTLLSQLATKTEISSSFNTISGWARNGSFAIDSVFLLQTQMIMPLFFNFLTHCWISVKALPIPKYPI